MLMSVFLPFFLLYSYAEVRAEQRRELGIEETQPEITADKVRLLSDTSLFLFFLNELLHVGSEICEDAWC